MRPQHLSLNQYLQEVSCALEDADGAKAASLLSFQDLHIMNPNLQLEHPDEICHDWFTAPFDEMLAAHLRCIWATVCKRDPVEAFACQSIVVQRFSTVFRLQQDQNWTLPLLFVLCVDLRRFSYSANTVKMRNHEGQPGDIVERAASQIMALFRICSSDNRADLEDSKKWGLLNIVNQLLKIYFKLNKLKLCDALIRAIENLPFKDDFSLAQKVTYKYYVGKKAVYDGNYADANECLSFAFTHCHKDKPGNKRAILVFLVPVRLLLGYIPESSLLQRYNIPQFSGIVESVRIMGQYSPKKEYTICCSNGSNSNTRKMKAGNVRRLNQVLEEHDEFFIRQGVYLMLEKLKFNAYRNLFKKVYNLLGTHQVPVGAFTAALQFEGIEDVDDEEVQCLLANLIFQGQIKGYISEPHNKLVVSKNNAFPKLSTCQQ